MAGDRRKAPQATGELPHDDPVAHNAVPHGAFGGSSQPVPRRVPAGLSPGQVVSMPLSEDFQPFGLNITTSRRVHEGAAANRHMQVAGYAITSGNEDGNFIIDPAGGTIRGADRASFAAGEKYLLAASASDGTDPSDVGPAVAEIAQQRLDEGLFAWWQLDEVTGAVAFDSSGNQRDAWLSGSACWVPRATADHALQLNGINAGFSRFDPASPAGPGPFTVAAWVKVPPEHAAEAVVVQQKGDSGPGYQRVSVTAGGNVRFVVYGNHAGASDEGFQFDLVSATTIHDGHWHHVACVRDGADGRVFIDGVESAAGSGTPRVLEADSIFSVGYDAVTASGHLAGSVDDVRIYQQALTVGQIARVAAAPKIAIITPPADGGIIVPEGVGLMMSAGASSPSGAQPAISWSMLSGPGAVAFDDPAAAETGVSFSAIGIHVLRATASLGNDEVSRDMAVVSGCTAVTPFACRQVGTDGTGSHVNSGPGAYRISGDSAGIHEGGTSDGYYLLGQVFSGNFDVMVRVDGALDDEAGYPLGIAGLIVRAGAEGAADAAGGFIGLRPADGVATWIRRTTAGAGNEVSDFPEAHVPHWCRITRSGALVEFWQSPDGIAWTLRGTMHLAGDLHAGLCWSSNVTGYPGTAFFSGLAGFCTGNQGAMVNAGADFHAGTTIPAQLCGIVNDDGLPGPPATMAITWQVLCGPGPVEIVDPSDPLSTVTFAAPGSYVLRLLASDGALTTFDDVTVTVADPLPVLTVEATTPAASEQGPVNGVFTITRSAWLAGDLSVAFTLGGDAENLLDYDEVATSAMIPDGKASVEIVVAPIADGLVEGPESVTLTLAAGGYLISGAAAEISIADSNHAPEWASPVHAAAGGTVGMPYSGSIAAAATDPDAGDDLVFTKVSGPEWLGIAADGTLTGTPKASDVGLNQFTVRVSDPAGEFSETTIEITVGPTILYLDANGETAGSGACGGIAWGNSPLWSAEPAGVSATHGWVPGATAVLAAGEDAAATTITLDGSQLLAALVVEEGAHVLSGGALVLAVSDAVFDISTAVTIESALSGNRLAKTGAGTLTLTGPDHALSGELAVLDGSVEIAGTLTPANGLTVAAGAVLAGEGTVAGHVSVSGTVAPGADLGVMSTGPLAMNDGSTLAWRIDSWAGNAGTDHDLLAADSLALSGTLNVVVDATSMADFTGTAAGFTLVTTKSGISGLETVDFRVNSASLPQANGHWNIVANGSDLVLTYTPPSPFEQWQLAQFAEKSTDLLVAGELADPDADALPNLIEYALGTDPEVPGVAAITLDFVEIGGSSFVRLRIPRNPDASDIEIVVEVTSDLSDPGSWSALDTVIETDEPALRVVRDALGGARRFIRLRVTR